MSRRKPKGRSKPQPGAEAAPQPASAPSSRGKAVAGRRLRALVLLLGGLAIAAGGLWWWGYFERPVELVERYEDGQPRKIARFERRRVFRISTDRWGSATPGSPLAWYWVPEMALCFPDGKVSEFGPCRPFPVKTGDVRRDLPAGGLAYEGLWTGLHPTGTTAFEVRYWRGMKDGPLRAWHKTGELQEQGTFKQNQKVGKWLTWHPNGQKDSECDYTNGQPHGLARTWFEDGRLKSEQHFEYGKQTGIERVYGGEQDQVERTWVAGKENGLRKVTLSGRRIEEFVVDDKRHGPHKVFRADGALLTEGQYANDRMEGKWTDYSAAGKPTWERHYRADELHGAERRWRADGTLESEGNYQAGRQDGRWTEYAADGIKRLEGDYVAGKRHGVWTTCENGEPARQTTYDQGRVVKRDLPAATP
jgi:antitoxin component YwqK of YwqJK toxin-antitoxin module